MKRFENADKCRQPEDLISQFVRDISSNHSTKGISDHCKGLLSDGPLNVLDDALSDQVSTGGVFIRVALSPREVDIKTLPPAANTGILQRQHDAVIHTESMDYKEREAFPEDLSNHLPEPIRTAPKYRVTHDQL